MFKAFSCLKFLGRIPGKAFLVVRTLYWRILHLLHEEVGVSAAL